MKPAIALSFFFIIFIQSCKKESALINDRGTAFNFTDVNIDSSIEIGDIYTSSNFAAFTDIANYNGSWYVAFRIGTKHSGGENGQIKILTSTGGNTWEVKKIFLDNDYDLREGKLTIDSANNLMFLNFWGRGKRNKVKNFVSKFNPVIDDWETPVTLQYSNANGEQYSFWRPTFYKGVMYCIAYRLPLQDESNNNLCLFKSDDNFSTYKSLGKVILNGNASETTIRFTNDSMYMIARTESINTPIGISLQANYTHTNWIYNPLYSILASPNFLFYKNKMLITARDSNAKTFKFFSYNLSSKKVEKEYTFPSGYETGYGGMSFNPDNPDELWVSYYSITQANSSIKLAKINLLKFL